MTTFMDMLTLGEVESIEDATGQSLPELVGDGKPPTAKVIRLLALTLRRRTDPAVTLADLASMTYAEAVELVTGAVEAVEPAPKASPIHAGRVTLPSSVPS